MTAAPTLERQAEGAREPIAVPAARWLERTRLRGEQRRLLAENVEALAAEALTRRCQGLLSTVDLEPLQDLVLATFCEVAGARSAALWVRGERGSLVLRVHRGLRDREELPEEIDPRAGPLASRIEGGVPFPRGPDGNDFYAPLVTDGAAVGLILLADGKGPFGARSLAAARAIAAVAAVALRNAGRFADLERGGLHERSSPAYNLSYFIDYAGKELYKAQRYGRQFSIVAIRIENLEALRTREDGDPQRRVVDSLAALVRDADILARVSDAELYVLLPETDRFGAMTFERRALALGSQEEAAGAAGWVLALGGATFPADGENFDALLDCCRRRMDEARHTLRRALHLEGLGFWETVDALLGSVLPATGGAHGAASRILPSAPSQFEALQRELGRELSRDPRSRGLVYVGTSQVTPELPIIGLLPAGEVGHRVYVFGRRGSPPLHPAVTPVYFDATPVAGGRAAHEHDFALYLAEHAAYAFLRRPGSPSFHSSDRLLVDHLVGGLQRAYDLQPY